MTNTIKKFFNVASAVVLGGFVLWSCEPEADALGSQFFNGAQGVEEKFDLIAYNVNNNDSIRTDAGKIDSIVVGALKDPYFGSQSAAYISQARLNQYAPDFGTNPVLDSAVITITPRLHTASDSITTTTIEDYVYNDEDEVNTPAKKVVTTHRIFKYGKTKNNTMNLQVHRVNDFLGVNYTKVYSNKEVNVGELLGSKVLKGTVSAIAITKDSDNSDLYKRDANIRIPLDSTFFQNNIIKKGKSPELTDAASFIRYFRGVRLSVSEDDGYFFKMVNSGMKITLYYKYDLVTDGVTKRKNNNFEINLSDANNARFSQIKFDRAGSTAATDLANINSTTGDSRLYLQGMGGPGAGFKIQENTLSYLKNKYKNDKVGIMSAKIRVFTDPNDWKYDYTKPLFFVVRQKDSYKFLTDFTTLGSSGYYQLVKTYNLSKTPASYDITITQTIKDFIEKEEPYKDIVINVGSYTTDSSGNLAGMSNSEFAQNFNTRSYTPNRALFVGTVLDQANPMYKYGSKLVVIYGQK